MFNPVHNYVMYNLVYTKYSEINKAFCQHYSDMNIYKDQGNPTLSSRWVNKLHKVNYATQKNSQTQFQIMHTAVIAKDV